MIPALSHLITKRIISLSPFSVPEIGLTTHGLPYRRKLRHNTHLEDLKQKVIIIREHHPFQGQTLEVYGRTHRKGVLLLNLILPDGSRSLIPASWTDLELRSPIAGHQPPATIGALPDLLHARKVVDSLLRKLDDSEQIISVEERKHAQATTPLARSRTTEHLGRSRSRNPKNGCCHRIKRMFRTSK